MKRNKEKLTEIINLLDSILGVMGIIFILMILVFACKSFFLALNIYHSNISIKDTEGVIVQTLTGSETDSTEISIDVPSNPRDVLEYQLQYGVGGVDYIVASPTNQPKLNSQNASENTEKMHLYLYQNRLNFEIKDPSREGYIMFITTFPIKNTSNIFLGVDGKTIGWLDKEKNLSSENSNEYLYQLNNIQLIGSNNYHFSKNLSNQKTISINAVLGENSNYIEKIIIFFK